MKNSECAISKLYNKNGRPSRCEKLNEKKKPREDRAKKEREQKKEIREDEHEKERDDVEKLRTDRVLCHLSGKMPEETEQRQRQETDDRHRTVTIHFIGPYPQLFY